MKIYNVSEPIVQQYISLVEAGKKDIQDVPEMHREEVANILGISLAEITLAEAIDNKVAELSKTCEATIVAGTDVTLSNGTKHYSLTSNDQNNIKNLFDIAVSTKTDGIPYHADNEECELYPYADIIQLYVSAQEYILYHNTYFNMLKTQVKSMTDIDSVSAVEYGVELNEEYAAKMNDILTQSSELFAAAMESYGISSETASA